MLGLDSAGKVIPRLLVNVSLTEKLLDYDIVQAPGLFKLFLCKVNI